MLSYLSLEMYEERPRILWQRDVIGVFMIVVRFLVHGRKILINVEYENNVAVVLPACSLEFYEQLSRVSLAVWYQWHH